MSIKFKIQSLLLPESWQTEKRQQYLKEHNFKEKFGNSKKEKVENGYYTYIQKGKKTNDALAQIELEDGVKAFVEKDKVSYKQQRKPRKDQKPEVSVETLTQTLTQPPLIRQ